MCLQTPALLLRVREKVYVKSSQAITPAISLSIQLSRVSETPVFFPRQLVALHICCARDEGCVMHHEESRLHVCVNKAHEGRRGYLSVTMRVYMCLCV